MMPPFSFYCFISQESRELLQHQQMLFVNIEGKNEKESIAGGCGLPNVGTDGEKNGYPYDTPYVAEIFREYETGCRMAAGNDQ